MCVLLQISFATILRNILRSVNNTQNNRKNKKGARFFETQCILTYTLPTGWSKESMPLSFITFMKY